ncbi:hypothetical protein J437_LFUL006706 [Ladona fulva]|uniref:Uncharacterized protein n=1 Tax=Ladona fulva TaxID=123851 RepID=A0A8K0JSZ5_LADFU|nr:hypothetical protein J437_LFUL006706 [Ladona fulva]
MTETPNSETGVTAQLENETKKNVSSLSWRTHVNQVMVVIGMNLHSMSVGTAIGFPTIALSEFSAVNTSTKVGSHLDYKLPIEEVGNLNDCEDQASWFGSVSVTSILLGSLVASAVQPRFGCRTSLIVGNVFLASAWSLTSVAQQPTLILASTVIASLYAGSMVAPLLVHQSETLAPQYLQKPILLSLTHISLLIGFVFEMSAGALLGWRTVAAINTAFPGTCLAILFLLPESPTIERKRKQSSISLTHFHWFCGLHHPEDKRNRDKIITQEVTVTRKTPRFRYIGLLTASLCYYHLCGMSVIRTYSVSLLELLSKGELPSYIHEFPIILGCFQICGSAVGLIFRRSADRACRLPILLSAFLGNIGCSLALGLYSHFFIHKLPPLYPGINVVSAVPSWLPTVLLGIFSFCSCMSIPLVPYSFAGEFFPSFATGFPSRLAIFISSICCFSSNKLFFLTVQLIGLRGFFWTYAITGTFCSGVICILLPRDLGCHNAESIENPPQETGEDLIEDGKEQSNDMICMEKSKVYIESFEEIDFQHQESREMCLWGKENEVANKYTEKELPDWLGDISQVDCHGGWLIEETRKGGWNVSERRHRQPGRGRRSMFVEEGTWIGHMLKVVTTATLEEEKKDFSKWKLANQAQKCWIITKGPNNQWQICSTPRGNEMSEEDDSEESEACEGSDGSSNSDELNNISIISDENESTDVNAEPDGISAIELKCSSNPNIHLKHSRSFVDLFEPTGKFISCYKRSSSLDASNHIGMK